MLIFIRCIEFPSFIIDAMKDRVKMHDFIFFGKANTSYIYYNQTQQWCDMVYELNPIIFYFINDFLHGGEWTWRLVLILLFFNSGGGIIWWGENTLNPPKIVIFLQLKFLVMYGHHIWIFKKFQKYIWLALDLI